MSVVARKSAGLSRDASWHGRTLRHGTPARFSRLGATAIRMSRLFLSPRWFLARRLVADALQTRAKAPTAFSTRSSARRRHVLRLRRAHLDVAAIAVGLA